jgi:gliding motility-associated lipoprotein GldD
MDKSLYSILLAIVLYACSNDTPIPKPPTYLKTELPDHTYRMVSNDCPYELKLAEIYNYKPCIFEKSNFCIQQIDLGPLNGSLFLYYISIPSKDSLPAIINYANDKVDDHKIKADKIDFTQLIDRDKRVFGTFFELKGNVATNFQFYLTDSTNNFLRGEVLLNCRPNYDSLRPSLEYLKQDLLELVNNFKWRTNQE